jgi:hypothetical protein
MAQHAVDTVDGAAKKLAQDALGTGKALVKDAGQAGQDIAQSTQRVSRDLFRGHFSTAGKDAATGLADTYEDVKTTNDDVLTLFPRLVLTDSSKGRSTDPAIAANDVLHSNTFLHDGVLSDRFFRHDANANVSDCASAWDLGQVLEADTATGDMHKFDQDLAILEKYRGGRSPADLGYGMFGGKNSPLGFDAGWKPVIGADANQYYDDNAWIGIALLDADKASPNQKYLDEAKKIMDLEMQGAQGTDNLPHPGGEFWCREKDSRNTVSSAGAAQLALMLHEKTKTTDPKQAGKYLQFAEKQFDWVDQNLKADNGLYGDHIDSNGSIDSTQYSYNQGLMLGDATMLYQITGEAKYLDKAKGIADKSVQDFQQNGPFSKQLTFFNAVYFKNLMLLDNELKSTPGQEPNPAYRQALAGYAQSVKNEIDPSTSVITTTDGHDNGARGSTALDQSSAVQILELAQKYPPA